MIYIDDEEIQEAIQEQVDQTASDLGGKKQYFEYLNSYSITDHLFRFTLGVGICENELYIAYTKNLGLIDTDDESVMQHIDDEFVRTKHIFIQNDEGEDIEKNRADAQTVRDKLASGEDIDDYIGTKYNQDPYITADGYYFTDGEMKEEYENAAFALDIGGVSDVVEVENGFFVIVRLALEDEYIVNHFDELKEQYIYSVFSKFIKEKKENISITLNEYGQSIDFSAIK
jgi:parvulin-like peptidyl-prolyl isomerase